ncbi:hypothetical protein [Saccharibacillus sacchari]|uniref:Uncharacterized protein n=1 Tax=Saccharibacillus sacchari TaxID=456493 RepID=A0ACC6PHT6_9BACL
MNELLRRRLTRTSLSALLLSSLVGGTLPLAGTSSAQAADAATDAAPNAVAAADPVRAPVENLGRPFAKAGTYAQNVWDMQLWNGKIYIGQGNSSNQGSAVNAGPIPLTTYDPASGKFGTDKLLVSSSQEQTYVDEEQIDVFKVLNGQLYIPGHDPKSEAHTLGNFYRLDPSDGKWRKIRTIPGGVHTYDMAYYQGNLFAATGWDSDASILRSSDGGQTWSKSGIPIGGKESGRNYSLFPLNGNLYAVSSFIFSANPAFQPQNGVLEISPATAGSASPVSYKDVPLTTQNFFPGLSAPTPPLPPAYIRPVRTTTVGSKLMYIAGQGYNDHQWLPKGLFVASSVKQSSALALPGGATAMDILTRGDKVYVLAYTESGGTYTNLVFETGASAIGDSSAWTETVRFRQNTFARSFELQGGDFYFGLGSHDANNPVATTGTILRIQDVLPE